MSTLTVNINDKKSEKVIKAVLDALGLNYNIEQEPNPNKRPLNESEQLMYNRLKKSAKQIKDYKEGKIEVRDARTLLDEL